jgi:hypothetical protein
MVKPAQRLAQSRSEGTEAAAEARRSVRFGRSGTGNERAHLERMTVVVSSQGAYDCRDHSCYGEIRVVGECPLDGGALPFERIRTIGTVSDFEHEVARTSADLETAVALAPERFRRARDPVYLDSNPCSLGRINVRAGIIEYTKIHASGPEHYRARSGRRSRHLVNNVDAQYS